MASQMSKAAGAVRKLTLLWSRAAEYQVHRGWCNACEPLPVSRTQKGEIQLLIDGVTVEKQENILATAVSKGLNLAVAVKKQE